MSSEASNRMGVASKIRPSTSVTRIASASAPATTCAFVTTYPSAMTNPDPTDPTPHVPAETLSVLASASAAMARAFGSSGRSTSGAGSGSNPTNTSGSPDASSRSPNSTATSETGGRMSVRVRTVVEEPASSESRGTGPIAAMFPTSQMTRSAWAIPKIVPPTRSAALRTPVPRARAMRRPIADPTVSPRPTASEEPGQDEERTERRIDVAQELLEPGQGQDREHAAADRADQPADLGQRARPESEQGGQDRPARWR